MGVAEWLTESFYNGELFFYVIPLFLLILLIIVIFIPEEDTEDKDKDKDKDKDRDFEQKKEQISGESSFIKDEPEMPSEKKEPVKEKPETPLKEKEDGAIEEKKREPATYEDGLEKTRKGFISKLMGVFSASAIDDDMMEELEEILYTADIGTKTVTSLLEEIEGNRKDFSNGNEVKSFLKKKMKKMLEKVEKPFVPEKKAPFVILMAGVNGAGKTTTIAKLVTLFEKKHGLKTIIAAADTFRAAAKEQIEKWGERTGAEVVSDKEGADPGAVTYNAIQAARAKNIDVVIVDTAGRLQNRVNLMKELEKVYRVAGKACEGAPHEVLLVLDANSGQNAVAQAEQFNSHVPVSGLVMTKLDGTAKGGTVLSIANELELPIYFIGIGEQIQDLVPFDSDKFVEALFK
ncbi:MAG: signal recognition particle-docking protein FtsY [bacterium]